MPPHIASFFSALLLSAALVASAFFVGEGLRGFRATADRYVSVKGLAEREVKANLAIWQVRYTVTGNELAAAQTKVDADATAISAFLKENGFQDAEIQPQRVEVTDCLAQGYNSNDTNFVRYVLARNITVRSENVDQVEKISSLTGELVKKGVVLDYSNTYAIGPFYIFNRLNDIKPEMIAEATRNARAAADQFAKDSGAHLGAIRQASQGYFTILPRNQIAGADESSQLLKTVRVVTGVDYQLQK
jgi:hypothetical protein